MSKDVKTSYGSGGAPKIGAYDTDTGFANYGVTRGTPGAFDTRTGLSTKPAAVAARARQAAIRASVGEMKWKMLNSVQKAQVAMDYNIAHPKPRTGGGGGNPDKLRAFIAAVRAKAGAGPYAKGVWMQTVRSVGAEWDAKLQQSDPKKWAAKQKAKARAQPLKAAKKAHRQAIRAPKDSNGKYIPVSKLTGTQLAYAAERAQLRAVAAAKKANLYALKAGIPRQ